MRPTFELPVPGDGRAVLTELRGKLAAAGAEVVGQVRSPHAYVRLPAERRSLLSPHLELELRERAGSVVLYGRFSPRPNVWMGFMAVFFTLGLVGVGGLMYGLAQMTVDGPTWTIWAAPASVALIAFVYGAAFIGQGLSGEEMYELRAFVEETARESRSPSEA
jgi:hypothetical protein